MAIINWQMVQAIWVSCNWQRCLSSKKMEDLAVEVRGENGAWYKVKNKIYIYQFLLQCQPNKTVVLFLWIA